MKKTIYSILLLIDVGLMIYIGYYIKSHPKPSATDVTTISTSATSTLSEQSQNVKTFPLASGGKIIVSETNPIGASLSTLTITTEGIGSTSPITLETNKVTNIFATDLNHDTFEELIIVSTAQGSGSYGEATIFTTKERPNISLVHIPPLTEDDTEKGRLFEGYMGHDNFNITDGTLVREYPIYNATDTNSNPTGVTKKIYYILNEKDNAYYVTFSDSLTPASTTHTLSAETVTKSMSLPGTTWIWTTSTQGSTTSKAPDGKFILTFSGDMKFFSTTDCNNIVGIATSTKDTLQLKPTVTTAMYCENSRESIYANLLSKTKTYSIANGELQLVLADKSTLTFKKR